LSRQPGQKPLGISKSTDEPQVSQSFGGMRSSIVFSELTPRRDV